MRQRTQDSTSRKKTKRRWATNDSWFHTHVHSEFSTLDAISSVDRLVEKAKQLNQPAIALTDHGNMSGAVQLYRAGQKFGLPVFPGFEGYLVDSTAPVAKKEPAPQRYH
jgi:DNA polymerase-3 subunit alpha